MQNCNNELFDINLLQSIFDCFNLVIKLPISITDVNGKFIATSGNHNICDNFYCLNPETSKECFNSKIYASPNLNLPNNELIHQCPYDLLNIFFPIIINNTKCGNLVLGNFLLKQPDYNLFIEKAKISKLSEEKFKEDLKLVPVWSLEELNKHIELANRILKIIVEKSQISVNNATTENHLTTNLFVNEEFRNNLAIYKSILETSPDDITIADLNGDVKIISNAALKIFGYDTVDEVIGMNCLKFIADDYKQFATNRIEKLLKKEDVGSAEYLGVKKDGTFIDIEINSQLMTNENNEPSGLLFIVRDITERKKSEYKLKRTLLRYNSLFKTTLDGIWLLNLEGEVVEVNDSYCKIIGYEKEEILGKHIWDFDIVQTKDDVKDAINKIVSAGYLRFNSIHKCKSGNKVYIEVSTNYLPSEKLILAYLSNINDRVTYQNEIEKSETKYRMLAETAADIIVLYEPNGTIQYLNNAGINKFKLKNDYTLHNVFEFIPDTYKSKIYKNIQERESGKMGLRTFEIELNDINNDTFPVEINSSPIIQDNNIVGYLSIVRDITDRKQFKEALIKSEARFKTIFEGAPDAMFIADISDGKILSANTAATTLLKRPLEEILTMNQHQLHPPVYANKVKAVFFDYIKNLFNKVRSTPFETFVIQSDGNIIPVEVNAQIIEFNNISALLGTFRDISERKIVEKKLFDSEQRFKQVAENSMEFIWEVDENGLYTYTNNVVYKILGYTPKEMIGKLHFYDTFKSDNKEALINIAKTAFKNKQSFTNFINTNLHKNGQEVILSTNAIPVVNEEGILIGYRGVDIDITKRIKEEKLKERQLKFTKALNEIAEIILQVEDPVVLLEKTNMVIGSTLNVDRSLIYKVSYSNQALLGLCEWLNKESELNVRSINTYPIDPFHIPLDIIKNDKCFLISHKSKVGEAFNHDGCGELIHNFFKIKSLLWYPFSFNEDGFYLFIFNYMETENNFDDDIFGFLESATKHVSLSLIKIKMLEEKVESEKRLKTALDKAEEMNRLKSLFLANMNHELRTPLNGILGFASVLASELTDSDFCEMANNIHNSAKRLDNTLNLILDLANLESEKDNIDITPTEIVDLTKKIADKYHNIAAKKNLVYKLNISNSNTTVLLDPNLYTKAISNLLNNAFKYTLYGKVEVEAGLIDVSGKEHFYVKISDTGIGIPKDKTEIIWEPFRQVSEGLSRGYQGAGLGLSIAKKIIDLLHGSISLKSELGEGTIFTIYLPTSNGKFNDYPNANKTINKSNINVITSKKPNILYVEDDCTNREVLEIYLRPNFNIAMAEDAETAVNLLTEKKFDIILIDINLGIGMNGIELAKYLRSQNDYCSIPLIAVTAYTSDIDKHDYITNGFNAVLGKPYEKEELYSLLNLFITTNN